MKTVLYVISTLQRSGPALVLYGLVKNLDRTRFIPIVVTLSDEKENSLKPEFEKLGIKIYCLRKNGVATFFSGAYQFRRLLKQIQPDIIHANSFRDILLTGYAAPRKYKKCATVHCDSIIDYPLKYGRFIGTVSSWLQTRALMRIPLRLACSGMLAELLNLKYPEMHFDFVDNGVDTDKFHPAIDKAALRRELGLPIDKKIVIWAGSFITRKDPLTMAKAILKIKENSYYFVFCGARGALLDTCKELLKKRTDVLFTGYITAIERYYQAADIYVSTSRSEGLPLAVLEAQFCGLVPLLSDIAQHRYLDKEVGHIQFFKPADETGLLHLLDLPSMPAQKSPLKDYYYHFSAAGMAKQYQDYYDAIN